MKHQIIHIEKNSIGAEVGIEKGDYLLSIDDIEIVDVFDYRLFQAAAYLEMLIEKADGETWLLEIEKDIEEDMGLVFESGLMADEKSCDNHCIFCFIDQLPPGMRETLYFKDDDSRLSFLTGNYVTLTNMTDGEIDRLIAHRLSPVNISVHATDEDIRFQMVKNKHTRELMKRIKTLDDGGIHTQFQIVLVKDVNDGDILIKSIKELMGFTYGDSLSVVPVGLTKFRDGLYPIEPFTQKDARNIIQIIESFHNEALIKKGVRFVYPGDELFYLAGLPIPGISYYDDFLQIENGVGMSSLFVHEVTEALAQKETIHIRERTTIVTGNLFYPTMMDLIRAIDQKSTGEIIEVVPVENEFFGEYITVSGLVTGADIMRALPAPVGDRVLLPSNLLRGGTQIFLDDITITDLENTWKKPIIVVENNGLDFIQALEA